MLYKLCKLLQFISPLEPHPGTRLIEFFRRVKPSLKNQIRMEQDGCVMIKKSSIVKPLTCHLCSDIINDATTITACLHTFCKGCIYRAFQDGTLHSCPKCHEYLGPSPQTYLRPDPMVQNFRNKIFMHEKPKATPSLSRQKEVEDKENGKNTVKTKDAESKDEASASVGD